MRIAGRIGGVLLFMATALGLGSCESKREVWDGPRIFSIGYTPALSFDKTRPLIIPVEGLALASDLNFEVDVTVTGTVQPRPFDPTVDEPSKADYYFDTSPGRPNPDKLEIVLQPSYLNFVKTGDTLNVAVHIRQQPPLTPERLAQRKIQSEARAISEMRESIEKANAHWQGAIDGAQKNPRNADWQVVSVEASRVEAIGDDLGQLEPTWTTVISFAGQQKQASVKDYNQHNHDPIQQEIFEAQWQLRLSQLQDLKKEAVDLGKKAHDASQHAVVVADGYRKVYLGEAPNPERIASAKGILTQEQYESIAATLPSREKFASIWRDTGLGGLDFAGDLATIGHLEDRLSSSTEITNHVPGSLQLRVAAVSSRSFTLMEQQDYRSSYGAARVKPTDISAFPLPEKEARDLFGDYLARNYFVVRLSLRNSENRDRLVNTGMIHVTGRAIVQSTDDKKGKHTIFTVPIEVTPHSKEQIYTVLDDTAVDQPRAVVFRTLEFAGTIASAYAGIFATDALDQVNLANGIGVPAFNKLWVDHMPAHERNVVNYAMNDLIKIPQHGTTGHKFLFFPKSKIEAIVIDQTAYGPPEKDGGPSRVMDAMGNAQFFPWLREPGFQQPGAYVAYLTFDNMDIPFEDVVLTEDSSLIDHAVQSLNDLRILIPAFESIEARWKNTNDLPAKQVLDPLGKITKAQFDTFNEIANRKADPAPFSDPTQSADFTQATNNLQSIAKALDYHQSESPDFRLRSELFGNEKYGLVRLHSFDDQLGAIIKSLSRGDAATSYTAQYNAITEAIQSANKAMEFYRDAALIVANQGKTGSDLDTLLPAKPQDSTPTTTKSAADTAGTEAVAAGADTKPAETTPAGKKPADTNPAKTQPVATAPSAADKVGALQTIKAELSALGDIRGEAMRKTLLPECQFFGKDASTTP